jgi:2-oxoglutarate dehydrogenase E1 component
LKSLEDAFGPNSALVEELYEQYREDPASVPNHWKRYFDEVEKDDSSEELAEQAALTDNGDQETQSAETKDQPKKEAQSAEEEEAEEEEPEQAKQEGKKLQKIKGVSAKIADNMEQSLEVPTATSVRVLPMKMLIEDRDIINRYLKQK